MAKFFEYIVIVVLVVVVAGLLDRFLDVNPTWFFGFATLVGVIELSYEVKSLRKTLEKNEKD